MTTINVFTQHMGEESDGIGFTEYDKVYDNADRIFYLILDCLRSAAVYKLDCMPS